MWDGLLATVSCVGSLASIAAMIIAIVQARRAYSYREEVRVRMRRYDLEQIIGHIEKALELVRRLPVKRSGMPRGKQTETTITDLKSCFDASLSLLSVDGPDRLIRAQASKAQESLRIYEESVHREAEELAETSAIQSPLQVAMSLANADIRKAEGKAG